MRKLTEEEIIQIQELGACFFTNEEICLIMGINSNDLESAKVHVDTGRLKSEAEVRKSIFDLAKSGSGPAQVLAVGIIKEFNIRNISV